MKYWTGVCLWLKWELLHACIQMFWGTRIYISNFSATISNVRTWWYSIAIYWEQYATLSGCIKRQGLSYIYGNNIHVLWFAGDVGKVLTSFSLIFYLFFPLLWFSLWKIISFLLSIPFNSCLSWQVWEKMASASPLSHKMQFLFPVKWCSVSVQANSKLGALKDSFGFSTSLCSTRKSLQT